MRRVRIIPKNPNKLFETWLEEWRDEAAAQNPELREHFQKALEALRKYPLPLNSGKECILLQHFGNKLCSMIDKRLERHKAQKAEEEGTRNAGSCGKTINEGLNTTHLPLDSEDEAVEKVSDSQNRRKRTYRKKESKDPEDEAENRKNNKRTEDKCDDASENEGISDKIQEKQKTRTNPKQRVENAGNNSQNVKSSKKIGDKCKNDGKITLREEKNKKIEENIENDIQNQQKRENYSDKFKSLEEIELTEEDLRNLDQIATIDASQRKNEQERSKNSENASKSQETSQRLEIGNRKRKHTEDDNQIQEKNEDSDSAANVIEISDNEDYPYLDLEDRVYHHMIDDDVLMAEPGPSRNSVIAPLDEDDHIFDRIEFNTDSMKNLDNYYDDYDDDGVENVLSRPLSRSNSRETTKSPEDNSKNKKPKRSDNSCKNDEEIELLEEKSGKSQEINKKTDNNSKTQQTRNNYSDQFRSLEEIEFTEEQLRNLDQIAAVEGSKQTNNEAKNKSSENESKSQEKDEGTENGKNTEDDNEIQPENDNIFKVTSIEISDDEDYPYLDLKDRVYHKMSDASDDDVLMAESGPSRNSLIAQLDEDDEVFDRIELNTDNRNNRVNSYDDDYDEDEDVVEKVLSRPLSRSNSKESAKGGTKGVKEKTTKENSKKTTKTTRKASASDATAKGAIKKTAPRKATKRTAKAIEDKNENVDSDDDVVMVDSEPLTRIPSSSSGVSSKGAERLVENVEEEEMVVRKSDFSILPTNFDVILLVDTQEVKAKDPNDPVITRLTREATPFEVRHLNVGDFLWIARCRETKQELVLPYIVERKRVDDLAASIKDGRYHEQKFRLRRSGVHNVIYMVERLPNGSMHTSLPLSTLMQATVNSMVHDGFTVKFTKDQRDSVLYLASFTKILERLFKEKLLMECDKESLPKKYNVKDEQVYLMEFQKFYKATAKVRTWTVKEMFIKQLLQIKGLSLDGVLSIVQRYPTPCLLKKALDDAGDEGAKFLAKIPYGSTKRKLGPVLARTIWQLFTFEELK